MIVLFFIMHLFILFNNTGEYRKDELLEAARYDIDVIFYAI